MKPRPLTTVRPPGRLKAAFIALCCALCWMSFAPAPQSSAQAPASEFIRAERLGMTFISSIDSSNSPERYHNALLLGAGWNRWPLYWDRVEFEPAAWDWSAYDSLVQSDLRHGLQVNAILLGRPEFWQDGESIANLHEPIFADGTDSAPNGIPINPDNPWAQFVHRSVARYKPGGILARLHGFAADEGIRVWEIWNEPDFPLFWQGGSKAYARLLKTAAIVIKTLDPQATVLFGGMLYASHENFLSHVLREFQNDPLRQKYGWFVDVIAIHSYDDPWRSGWLAKIVQDTLSAYSITRPIWVNETGVSVWDDYPGPVWAASDQRIRLATRQQQAYYLIMSAAYAWSKDVDKVFFHQLYDDCGNQPPGTDFPPHQGELCSQAPCFGDAFGIYRNPSDAICFSQHPAANTPRPVAAAYRLLAEIFGREPFTSRTFIGIDTPVTSITFTRTHTQARITVLWNNTPEPQTFQLAAAAASAARHSLNDTQTIFPESNGLYTLTLKPAAEFNYPGLESNRSSAIGGEPIILVETAGG